MPNPGVGPIRSILDRYIVNNLIRKMKETAPMIVSIVDAPRPEYMRLLEYTTCVYSIVVVLEDDDDKQNSRIQ